MVDIEKHYVDMVEIQGTSDEIVRHKIKEAYKEVQCPCIVEDVGLSFEGFNGLPGPYIKDFLTIGHDKLVEMAKIGGGKAYAVCKVGYHDGQEIHVLEGRVDGRIVPPRGSGFGWDPIFEVNGKTFAEMSMAEKNKISHRAKAIEAFLAFQKQ